MTREDRIRALELAFKPEDGVDGTDFDCDVLDALQALRQKWVLAPENVDWEATARALATRLDWNIDEWLVPAGVGCTESAPCYKPMLRWVHSVSCKTPKYYPWNMPQADDCGNCGCRKNGHHPVGCEGAGGTCGCKGYKPRGKEANDKIIAAGEVYDSNKKLIKKAGQR